MMHRRQFPSPPVMRLEDQVRHLIYIYASDGRSIRAFIRPTPHRRMPLAFPVDSLQQPHQRDRPSSEFQDQLGDLPASRDPTPSTSREALLAITDPAYSEPPRPPGSSTHTDLNLPGWKRLACGSLAIHERISLITTIFSNRDEIEVVRRLCREDAQILVDAIYEAHSCTLSSPDNMFTDFARCLSIRCWVTLIAHYG